MVRNLFRRDTRPKTEDEQQLDHAVEKTREGAFGRIAGLFREQIITDETWEELEELLIQADVGPKTALRLVENARREVDREELKTPVEAETALRRQMVEALGTD